MSVAYPVDDLGRFGYIQELKRVLSTWQLLAYGMSYMLPIAPMAIFGAVFAASHGMPVLAYAIGIVVLMFTAFSFSQMVKAFPLSGSVYNYVGRGISAPFGFLAGWVISLDYILVPALLYLVASVSLHGAVATVPFLSAVPVWVWFLLFLGVNTTVNVRGIKLTARLISYTLLAELAVAAVFIGVGVWALATGRGHLGWAAIYNPHTLSWSVVFAGTSVALLSFLGFDGISLLSEETKSEDGKNAARRVRLAMTGALLGAGLCFVLQTVVASMLTPDPQALIADGDPNGVAFFVAAGVAGGTWLATLCAVATALAWGIPDSMAAQAAISRLLYAMARDKQLPWFLAKVSRTHNVPRNAVTLVALVSLTLGLSMIIFRDDYGIPLLSSLINFGAMTAFVLLHLSVIVYYLWRRRSRNFFAHLLMPLAGATMLGFVMWNATVDAQKLAAVWIGIGLLILAGMYLTGHPPKLSGGQTAQPARRVRAAV